MAYLRAPFLLLAMLGGLAVTANAPAAAPDVQGERQASLGGLLARASAADIARDREACASGQQPAAVARARAAGASSLPDAADLCVTVLIRTARDGNLMQFYRRLASRVAGSAEGHEAIPERIGSAVMQRSDRVAVGGGAGTIVTPALALDAGFTAAYAGGAAVAPDLPGMATLRPIAERCLGQSEARLGLCYSAGYAFGARARQGETVRIH